MSTQSVSFIRHAKTFQPEPGQSDYNRTLMQRGFKDSELIGEELVARNSVPEILISSGARRALQTAEVLLDVFKKEGFDVKHIIKKELYLSPVSTIYQTAEKHLQIADRVAIVAHNPGIHEAAYALSTTQLLEAPTGAVFHFKISPGFQFRSKIEPHFVIFPRHLK